MKILKYSMYSLIVMIFIMTGYIVNNYYEYEAKQNNVKEFRTIALKAFSLKAQGNYPQAIGMYEKAFKLYDKEHTSLADAADVYRKLGYIKQAKELYKKAYSVKNNRYNYLQNQALCEYLLKEYDESIKNINYLIHQDRIKSKYYKFLALNYYAKGDKDKAFGYYGVIANGEKYKNDKQLESLKKEYHNLETKPKPLSIVYKYKKTNNIKELESLAKEYQKDGYDIKALRASQKILFKEADNQFANKMVAELYFNHAELYEAHKYALKITEHDAKTLKILGASYQQRQEFKKALDAFEKSYAKEPNKDVLKAMIVCAVGANMIGDVENYIVRLTKIDPLLATKLIYAMETKSGVEHNFFDKVVYLTKLEFYKGYCDLKGCDDA